MSTYKTKGLILRRVEFGEADRILTFLTPEGKVSAIAKGVRRQNSKLGSHLELFGEVELMLARGRNLDVVTSARVIRSFNLSRDYELMRRGFLFLEMTDKLVGEESAQEVYNLLVSSLAALDELSPPLVELFFKLRLLLNLGYEPQLRESIVTHRPLSADRAYSFDPEGGGLVEREPHQPLFSTNQIKLWRLLMEKDLTSVARVKGVSEEAEASLAVCDQFYDYTFGKRFKSSEI